jgi:hypothetical protein
MLHTKFWFIWPSCFRGEDLLLPGMEWTRLRVGWNSSAWWVNSRKSPEYVQLKCLYLWLKAAGTVHMFLTSPGIVLEKTHTPPQVKWSFPCIHQISTRVDAYKYSFLPRTIVTWNFLPPELRSQPKNILILVEEKKIIWIRVFVI